MNIKHLQRIMVAGVIFLAFSLTSASAQGMASRKFHGRQGAKQCAVQLNLTQDQQTRIKAIFEKSRQEARQVKASNLTPEQKKARLMEIRKGAKNSVNSILTAEQREKAAQMRLQHRNKGKWGKMGAQARLNLTPAQKDQARSIFQTSRERMANVRSDARLSDTQKREKMAAIRRVAHNDFMQILTPEQKAKLSQSVRKSVK